jgi:fumarate reductase subunit C
MRNCDVSTHVPFIFILYFCIYLIIVLRVEASFQNNFFSCFISLTKNRILNVGLFQ